jgi:hypothetical protein
MQMSTCTDEPDYSMTEVTVAGEDRPRYHAGLSYDRLNYLRAQHYPRTVRAEPILDLSDLLGPSYPGTFRLSRGAR